MTNEENCAGSQTASAYVDTRRKLLIVLAASAMIGSAALAQQPTVFRVGWLSVDRSDNSLFFEAFRGALRSLGYVEGRNVVFDARWGEGLTEGLDELAVQLVQLKPSSSHERLCYDR